MKFKIVFFASLLALVSCHHENEFTVNGHISDAENKILFLEHNGLMETTVLDSVELDSIGEFSLKALSPQYPDFYSLRIENNRIIFSVDSTENITVDASYSDLFMDYKIGDSQANKDIKKLRKSLSSIQLKANSLNYNMGVMQRTRLLDEIEREIETHKKEAQKIILSNAVSPAAYYAIYQKIGDAYLFNPYVKEDKPFCAAVATAYQTYMPEYERTKNLYNLVMDAIKVERDKINQQAWQDFKEKSSTGYFDIELTDRNNEIVKLSSLEGKVILLDFSSYDMKNSIDYTFKLRDLYKKYNSKGLEIYQVSLDRSKIRWEESVANIPWKCVRDADGLNSRIASTYAVRIIPTMFLINREGNVIGRDYNFETVDAQIAKIL